jgi:hypothetical protein
MTNRSIACPSHFLYMCRACISGMAKKIYVEYYLKSFLF